MEQYLISQRQAVEMLKDAGLSRRAAYYRLSRIPSREMFDNKVFSRVDVDVLCAELQLEQGTIGG